ncbi:hypothetical protein Tco_1004046 [Tanacetum coccineum]|uniref:Uncharacterized protein n=1 Tax=Tanacetum coccineum TaxID=301880 RepID=A0ABQ5FC63_9ASTR
MVVVVVNSAATRSKEEEDILEICMYGEKRKMMQVWKSVEYGVSNELDTLYWGFLRVGTTFDIFHNIILIPYLEYGVLSPLDTAYWSLVFCGLLVSACKDTPYLLDGYNVLVFRIVIFKISSFKL